ncbi:MAG: sarcosine oxidase, gamma subunit [Sphingopyxis macrogoltabida]|uniref:Sarcosine oxidase, gamma subunit n=1 Tax=Sphingopyxis macrogoltabida TaxID=33050 RepID=A0A2W5KZR3_SPHMC|nr:MAG: sarcosine oxidase, gamma subunit [Sphingopyxis macrogoltabida]
MPEAAIAPSLATGAVVATPLPAAGRAILRCRPSAIAPVSEILGMTLPQQACRAETGPAGDALWLGPDEWLLRHSPDRDWCSDRQAQLAETPCSLVDVSHRQVGWTLTGDDTEYLLASGCALDLGLAAFPVGMCTRTMYRKAEIILWRRAPASFHLEVWRSFAGYVAAHLEAAASGPAPA